MICKRIVVFVLEDKHARFLQKNHPQKKKVNRIGISATKKVGGAVQRNRCKRIMREALRQVQKKHPFVTGKLIVLSAREACAEATMQEVLKDLTYASAKLDLFAKQEETKK